MTSSVANSRRWLFALLCLCVGAAAAEEGGPRLEVAPVSRLDTASLQRGAKIFVNYCVSCHSAQYMRYNRLTDLDLTEAQIRDNLMFATQKIGETMVAAMPKADAKSWFGAAPPDLSVESRIRGKDWIYSYFLGFYRDEKSSTGWNNLVFPNVAMPHVLWQLGGTQKLIETEYKTQEQAIAAMLQVRGLTEIEGGEGKYIVRSLALDAPGTMTPVAYREYVADLVNYMDFMAEPALNTRIRVGIFVLLFLCVFFVFAYWLKREYWKDVH